MKTNLILSMVLLCLYLPQASAQQYIFNDLYALNRLGTFQNEETVTGYYCLYEPKKAKRKVRSYHLQLFDQDLNSTGSLRLVNESKVRLIKNVNLGNSLMLLFYDSDKKEYKLSRYNNKGEETSPAVFTKSKENDKPQSKNGHLLTVLPEIGFIHYNVSSFNYELQLFSEDESVIKSWETRSKLEMKDYKMELLSWNENTIVSLITNYTNSSKNDGESHLLGTNLYTGEELFNTPLEDDQYAIQVTNNFLSDENVYVFGQYYEKNAEVFKAKSLGLFALCLDLKGNIISRKYLSWGTDINEFLPVNEKGKIASTGYLYFHDFIKTANGKMFGIAESYRRAADGWGIAASLLSPGSSSNLVKIVVEDFYIFEFSPEFGLNNISIVEKIKTDVSSAYAEFEKPQALAKYIQSMNGFDYTNTKISPDGSGFTINYVDKAPRNKFIYGHINYDGKEISVNEEDSSNKKFRTNTLPAKPGYILAYENFFSLKKKKTPTLRLEKLEE